MLFTVRVLLLVSACTVLSAETKYYGSNSLGSIKSELGSASREDGYVLSVSSSPERETRILSLDGSEVKRWVTEKIADGKVKTTTSDPDEVLSVEYTDASGRLMSEDLYVHGAVSEKATYTYRNGVLSSVSVSDPNGLFLHRDDYERSSDGKLRRITRTFSDGTVRKSSFGFAGERLREEITNVNGNAEFIRYNASGNVESREEWKGKSMVSRETYRYEDGKLSSSVETSDDSKLTVTRNYSAEGFVTKEVRERAGKTESTTERTYTDGKLFSERKNVAGLAEEWQYTYTDDGTVATIRYLKNGNPEKVTTYSDESSWVEELYRNGVVFMKVTWADGKKISEEFVRNGETVRTRRTDGK